MLYRFIGTESDIEPYVNFQHFGQSAELLEEIANDAIAGGCALLPDPDFQALGFTADELRNFATPGSHPEAGQEFLDKKRRALVRLHQIREAAQKPVEVMQSPVEMTESVIKGEK